MANEPAPKRATDEQLITIIRSGHLTGLGVNVADLADELLHCRRAMRADSRRAQQLRRLRWTVEACIMKVEGVHDAVVELGADRSEAPPPSAPAEDDHDRD